MSEWRSRCFPYHPHCQLLCCPVLKTEPTAANTRPSKPSGPWVSGKILISIDETGYRNAQNIIHFLNLVVTKRSQYALGSYVPVFPVRSLFNPCVPSKKHLTCQKQSPKSVDFFQQSTTKQRKRYVLKMRNRREVFFSLPQGASVAVDALQKEIITPFPTVQSNFFSRLRDPIRNTKKFDKCHTLQLFRWACKRGWRIFCALRDGHLEVWALAQRCNSFITRLGHFVYMCSNMSVSFHNLEYVLDQLLPWEARKLNSNVRNAVFVYFSENCNRWSPRLCVCRFNDTAVLKCAPILKLFGMSLLNRSFAVNRKQLQFSQCARNSAWCSYVYLVSLMESGAFKAL